MEIHNDITSVLLYINVYIAYPRAYLIHCSTGSVVVLPEELGGMDKLNTLDLSNNELSGQVPAQLQDLKLLGVLNLSYNNLPILFDTD